MATASKTTPTTVWIRRTPTRKTWTATMRATPVTTTAMVTGWTTPPRMPTATGLWTLGKPIRMTPIPTMAAWMTGRK
jgi:hypothetical protein